MNGLVAWAGTKAFTVTATTAITPLIKSTIGLLTSFMTTHEDHISLQEIIRKYDITCTLQTIEATCSCIESPKKPVKTALTNVGTCIHDIHELLTKIADVIATHQAGYISRWRTLNVDEELRQLEGHMEILNHRYKLLCLTKNVII